MTETKGYDNYGNVGANKAAIVETSAMEITQMIDRLAKESEVLRNTAKDLAPRFDRILSHFPSESKEVADKPPSTVPVVNDLRMVLDDIYFAIGQMRKLMEDAQI